MALLNVDWSIRLILKKALLTQRRKMEERETKLNGVCDNEVKLFSPKS